VHDFGDHRQGAHRLRSYSGREQQLGEIGGPAIGGRSQIPVEPPRNHITGADVMVCGEIEMRQQRMLCAARRRERDFASFQH